MKIVQFHKGDFYEGPDFEKRIDEASQNDFEHNWHLLCQVKIAIKGLHGHQGREDHKLWLNESLDGALKQLHILELQLLDLYIPGTDNKYKLEDVVSS